MPAIKRIDQSLRIDDVSARNFSLAVQRHFNQPPSFYMISRAIEQLPPQKRGIEGVVEWLRCEWPNLQYKGIPKQKKPISRINNIPENPRINRKNAVAFQTGKNQSLSLLFFGVDGIQAMPLNNYQNAPMAW